MANQSRELTAKLPYVALERVGRAGEENLRRQERFARAVFFTHGGGCAECAAYARTLAGAVPALADWDARVLVVFPPGDRAAATSLAEEAPGLSVLLDTASTRARSTAGVRPESAALLVADRFGDLWHGYDAGAGHRLPDIRELEDWLRYLGTLCPE